MRQAAILAGGQGTRIASLAKGLPKALLPVGGRPFVHYLLEFLRAEGVSEAVLLLGHKSQEVLASARAAAPAGLSIRESIEALPLGTGGALKAAEWMLDDRFLVMNGDTFLTLDLTSFERLHEAARQDGVIATVALVRHPKAGEKGSVKLGPDGQIVEFVEKGREGPGLINAGVYLVEKSGLADIPRSRAVSLEREVFPAWMRRGERGGLQGIISDSWFVDIGLPEDYLRVKDGFPRFEA